MALNTNMKTLLVYYKYFSKYNGKTTFVVNGGHKHQLFTIKPNSPTFSSEGQQAEAISKARHPNLTQIKNF